MLFTVFDLWWPLTSMKVSHPKLASAALPTKFGSIVYHIFQKDDATTDLDQYYQKQR